MTLEEKVAQLRHLHFGQLYTGQEVDFEKLGKAASAPSCKGVYVHLDDWGTVDGVNDSILKLDAKKSNTVTIKLAVSDELNKIIVK
jgi:hypothetical protein